MDKTIETLIKNYKIVCGKPKELTKEEKEKFALVNFDLIKQQLWNLFPGEIPFIENIDSNKGKVIFQDRFGRNTISIENLGYELKYISGNKIYVREKTIFEKRDDNTL